MTWLVAALIVLSALFVIATVVAVLLGSVVLGIMDGFGQAFGYPSRRRFFRKR